MYILTLSIFSILFLSNVGGYNIFVGYAADSKSHLGSMMPLIKRLAQAGHQITIFHASTLEKPPNFGQNISTVHLYFPDDPERKKGLGKMMFTETFHAWIMPLIYYIGDFALGVFVQTNAAPITEALNKNYDLVLVDELFGMHAHAFALLLKKTHNTPYIVFSTSIQTATTANRISLNRPWSPRPSMITYIPQDHHDKFDPENFWHRLYSFPENLGELLGNSIVAYFFNNTNNLINEKFDFYKLKSRSSFFLSDMIDRLAYTMPEGNDVKPIGCHCDMTSKKLEGDYLKFVNDPKSKGTIYIAFGSFIILKLAPDQFLDPIFEALDELSDYRIIFSYNGHPRNVSSHIMITSWAPQIEILNHPKTKAFLSHGGLKSIKESLCAKIPIIALPLFAEQAHNSKMILEIGLGTVLNKFTLSKNYVFNAIKEVLDNGKYQKRVEIVHDLYLDRVIPSLDEGLFYVEKVIRNKNRDHKITFDRKGMHLGWTEFMYLDSILCLLVVTYVLSK